MCDWSNLPYHVWAVVIPLVVGTIMFVVTATLYTKSMQHMTARIRELEDRLGQPIPQEQLELGTRYRLAGADAPQVTWVLDLIRSRVFAIDGKVNFGSDPVTEFVIHNDAAGERILYVRHWPSPA